MSDCKRLILPNNKGNYYLIICVLKSDEIDFFDNNERPLVYDVLCGAKESTET